MVQQTVSADEDLGLEFEDLTIEENVCPDRGSFARNRPIRHTAHESVTEPAEGLIFDEAEGIAFRGTCLTRFRLLKLSASMNCPN